MELSLDPTTNTFELHDQSIQTTSSWAPKKYRRSTKLLYSPVISPGVWKTNTFESETSTLVQCFGMLRAPKLTHIFFGYGEMRSIRTEFHARRGTAKFVRVNDRIRYETYHLCSSFFVDRHQ